MIDRIADLFRALIDLSRDLFKFYFDPETQEFKRKEKSKKGWDKRYEDDLKDPDLH